MTDSPAALFAGSITHLKAGVGGALVVTGSHGGSFVAEYALRLGAGALVCHDAGLGLQRAGVAGLEMLDRHEIPAVAVGHDSARIGDAGDMAVRGILSTVNRAAHALGLRPGQPCRDAVAALAGRGRVAAGPAGRGAGQGGPAPVHRHSLGIVATRLFPEPLEIVCLDSASDIHAGDAGKIVLTGSHGSVPADEAASAVKAGVRLAAFNDAGIGIEEAGIARLAVLDGMGIPGLAVAAASARIGDGRSTFQTGIVSRANTLAAALGIRPGDALREILRPTGGVAPDSGKGAPAVGGRARTPR